MTTPRKIIHVRMDIFLKVLHNCIQVRSQRYRNVPLLQYLVACAKSIIIAKSIICLALSFRGILIANNFGCEQS